MRKTIAFILSAGLLVAAFTGIACKPRNAKQRALLFAPEQGCQVTASYTLAEHECITIEGDTSNAPVGRFTDCESTAGRQQIFEVTVPEYGNIFIGGCVDGEMLVMLRDSCDPSAPCFTDQAQELGALIAQDSSSDCPCFGIYGCNSNCFYGMPAGKYYIVIDSYDVGVEYFVDVCFSSEYCYSGEQCN